MFELSEIRETINKHHFKGMGAVNDFDVKFLCDLIKKHRPKNVFELGVASGMSSSFILRALQRIAEDCQLYCLDFRQQYYVDKSKPVGYLIDEIIPAPGCGFEIHRGCWSGDAEQIVGDNQLDLIFIDANHMHPWPTLDTIMLLPLTNQNAWIVHHDIALQTKPGFDHGIGPFNVFDEFPAPKLVSDCPFKNIGGFQITNQIAEYEDILLGAMQKPWTVANFFPPEMLTRINECVAHNYSDEFAEKIKTNLETSNEVIKETIAKKKSA